MRKTVPANCRQCGKVFNALFYLVKEDKGKFCSHRCVSVYHHPKGKAPKNFGISFGLTGEKHHKWKGENVGYRALHNWVEKELGNPNTCEYCGITGLNGHKIHWANISRRYLRDLSDWIRLCARCHHKYDKKYASI